MAEDFFDRWAESIKAQMESKGHGFDTLDNAHVVAMLVLVGGEIYEAIDVAKKRYPNGIDDLGEELADALIRMGHFAATTSSPLSALLPFESFNALGKSRADLFGAFQKGQWALIARLGRLAGQASDVANGWEGRSASWMERAFAGLFASIAGAAVALDIDLDQAIADKTAINSERRYRFGLPVEHVAPVTLGQPSTNMAGVTTPPEVFHAT